MAKSKGKALEQRVKDECLNLVVTKVPEDVRYIAGRVVRKKTKFDFCVAVDSIAAFFDCKEVLSKDEFYIKSYVLDEKKLHQWVAIKDAYVNHCIAGYLIHFKSHSKISWVNAQVIDTCIREGVKSVNPDTVGVVSQPDDAQINLRKLLYNDRHRIINRLNELRRGF